MDYKGRWLGIFQPDRNESAQLGKMTKRKATKRCATNVADTTLILVPKAVNKEN